MRRGLWLMMLGVAATVASAFPASATLSERQQPSTLDDLFALFGVDAIPADVVVVVDTSGSMSMGDNPPYPSVIDAYNTLVDALPEGDNLSVITFDVSPTIAFQGALVGDRASARLALPASAEGAGTDIGSALEATLLRLDRADAAQVQIVIFLTDGRHEPAPGSLFPDSTGERWDQLRLEAGQIADVRNLQVLGFSLGGRGAGGMDLLRNVFGNPVINAQPAEQLPEFFRDAVRRTQLLRLQSEIDKDIARGVAISASGSGALAPVMEIDVPIRSNLEYLDTALTVESVAVTLDGVTAVESEVLSDPRIVLPPGGASSVRVRVEAPVGETGFKVPPETEERQLDVAVTASYVPEPTELLSEAVSPELAAATSFDGTYEFTGTRTFGWSIVGFLIRLAGLLLLLFLLYWLWRRYLRLPDLVGGFDVTGASGRKFLPLKGKRQTLSAREVPNAGPAEVEFYTRRGRPNRVFVRVLTPQFTSLAGRLPKVISADEEIRAGSYRLGGGSLNYRARQGRKSVPVEAMAK